MLNPDIVVRCPVPFAGAHRWLEAQGFDWWTRICDSVPIGRWFTVRQVVKRLDVPVTESNIRYTRLVLAYIQIESGDEVVQRQGNCYRLR